MGIHRRIQEYAEHRYKWGFQRFREAESTTIPAVEPYQSGRDAAKFPVWPLTIRLPSKHAVFPVAPTAAPTVFGFRLQQWVRKPAWLTRILPTASARENGMAGTASI
jgi:hypothetical protein